MQYFSSNPAKKC